VACGCLQYGDLRLRRLRQADASFSVRPRAQRGATPLVAGGKRLRLNLPAGAAAVAGWQAADAVTAWTGGTPAS
jgi:hypothetical protein